MTDSVDYCQSKFSEVCFVFSYFQFAGFVENSAVVLPYLVVESWLVSGAWWNDMHSALKNYRRFPLDVGFLNLRAFLSVNFREVLTEVSAMTCHDSQPVSPRVVWVPKSNSGNLDRACCTDLVTSHGSQYSKTSL